MLEAVGWWIPHCLMILIGLVAHQWPDPTITTWHCIIIVASTVTTCNTDCDHMHGLEEHVDTPVVTLSVDPTDTEWGSNTIITTWTTWQVSSSNPYTRPPLLFFCYSAVGDMQSFTKDLVDGLFQAVVDLPATLGIIKVQSEPVFA